jgi:hypothetical protein
LRRLSRCGGTTNQPEGWKAHHSIHSLAFDLLYLLPRRSLSLNILSRLLILALTHCLFSSAGLPVPAGANPKRRHVVTRRDHCLSTPLLPCPYPISPLTFATTEVSFDQTTKNAIDSLCVNTPRGIIPVSSYQIVESPELCW